MDIPSLCPPPLATQLIQCWAYNPEDRPSFEALYNTIEELIEFKDEFRLRMCSSYSPSWNSDSSGYHSKSANSSSATQNASSSTCDSGEN